MQGLSESAQKKILIALAVYITSIIAANTLGMKIMPFLFGSHLSVGVFMFPVVFLMTDIIGEVYGKKVAKFFVLSGIISIALFILYNVISVWTPWTAVQGVDIQTAYNTVFGVSLRISIASLIAYAVGEYQDVLAFFFTKQKAAATGFWFRSLISNVWSQLFDTILFMGIAFYGVYPNNLLLSIMLSWWLYKVLMGVLYTPLAYIGIRILKGKEA